MRHQLAAAVALALATTTTAWSQEAIKIGGLLETSGFIASLGQPGLDGAMLAVEQVNAKGGSCGQEARADQHQHRERQHQDRVRGQAPDRAGQRRRDRRTDEQRLVLRGRSTPCSAPKTPMISNGGSRGIVLPAADKRWIFLAPLTDVLVAERHARGHEEERHQEDRAAQFRYAVRHQRPRAAREERRQLRHNVWLRSRPSAMTTRTSRRSSRKSAAATPRRPSSGRPDLGWRLR